jgi:hypothetical protein
MENSRKRGRPAGSKTKTSSVRVIKLNKDIPNSPIINDKGQYQWVSWGTKNDYPTRLLDLYYNSVTHSACIDFLVNAILGEGVDYARMQINSENEIVPNYLETWDELLRKVALDLCLYGGYTIQIIKNRNDKTYSFFHQAFNTVRFSKKDENGEILKAFLCKDWANPIQNKPIEVDILNTTDDVTLASGKPYLLVYTSYNPFDEYYPYPHYASALDAIRTDIRLKNYDLNCVANNFSPNGVLTLNPVSDDAERKMILDNIQSSFTGDDNGNNIIITFRSNLDDKPVEFTPIQSNVDGVDLFTNTDSRTTNRILAAHRLSKGLVGMSIDDAGFSSEGAILEAQFNLANKILINGLRKKLTTHINALLKMNGIEQELFLKPIKFNLQDVEEEVIVRDTVDVEQIETPDNEETQITE